MSIPQLSSETQEHFTPEDVAASARQLMGGIDLDPASCPEANQIIQAARIYTKQDDGLRWPWFGRVFLNPPGGSFKLRSQREEKGKTRIRVKTMSEAALWWARLAQDWQSGAIEQAFFVGFTLEILRHSQNGCPLPVQCFHRCYPRSRMRFGGLKQPTHANVLVYLPPDPKRSGGTWAQSFGRFQAEFKQYGFCEPGSVWLTDV